jgi:hypothetical protein
MLPDDYEVPTVLGESLLGIGIAPPRPFQLLSPPLGVRLRKWSVLRARVPEAAPYLDGHALARECDVNSTTQARYRTYVPDPPPPMILSTQR